MDYKKALIAYCDKMEKRKEQKTYAAERCECWIFGAINFAMCAGLIDTKEAEELAREKYKLIH